MLRKVQGLLPQKQQLWERVGNYLGAGFWGILGAVLGDFGSYNLWDLGAGFGDFGSWVWGDFGG